MSEIKPVAWVNPNELPSKEYPWWETELYAEKSAPYVTPLYSADQLAEAVAAERERCLRPIIEMSQKWDGGISDDLRSIIQTIRNAAK